MVLLVLALALGLAPASPAPTRAAAAPALQPPDPGAPGPYAVGVMRRTFTRTSTTTGQPRVLETLIWYPALADATAQRAPTPTAAAGGGAVDGLGAPLDAPPERAAGPFPVVLYSHGSGGTAAAARFFKSHLASHGFVVVAPPHPGNTAADCPYPCLPGRPGASAAMFADSALNRPDDISFAYEQTIALSAGDDPILHGLIDAARAGVSGHSFGGLTTYLVAARDPRFRAAVPMATSAWPAALGAAARIGSPLMLFGGDLDTQAALPDLQQLHAAIPEAGPEHWLIVLKGAGHTAFSDVCRPEGGGCGPNDMSQARAHALVNRWATAFLLRHVAGDARYAAYLDPCQAAGVPDLDVTYVPGG